LTADPTVVGANQQIYLSDLLTFSSPKFTLSYKRYIMVPGVSVWVDFQTVSQMSFPAVALAGDWFTTNLGGQAHHHLGQHRGGLILIL
jgi:hypothetical protein